MAIWDADLSTRGGAETAADQGGLACFITAGLTVLSALFYGGMAGFDTLEGQVTAGMIGLQALIALIAGFRLKAGKGVFWGGAVAAMLVLEIFNKLLTLTGLGGLVLNLFFLVMVVQGVRGAWALRRGTGFGDDDLEVFE
ncbi:hypothetical protein [Erythrobacter oryzae]|uniref:hypothetical protein n=1 Tax=Erythrobacter oryzae TaxID=3019556 RepID=UPI002556ADD5|nr:hypothetical protein [Erythrobacter sp. COR-2]